MPDQDAPLELRSKPDDATIREGLRRAYRSYAVLVLSLFLFVVPPLTALRAWADGAWLVRSLLALVVMGVGVWSTGRGLGALVRSGLAERSGKEVLVALVGGRVKHAGVGVAISDVTILPTRRAVVLKGRGLGAVVLARDDMPAEALARLRAARRVV